MNGHTQVCIHCDGTAYVHTGNSGELWSVEAVKRAREVSKVCAESRRVYWPAGSYNCACLACSVAIARLEYDRKNGRADDMTPNPTPPNMERIP